MSKHRDPDQYRPLIAGDTLVLVVTARMSISNVDSRPVAPYDVDSDLIAVKTAA